MTDLSKNYEVSRSLAAEGMVLLKNEYNTLPLKGKRVGVLGSECLDLIRGGGGSAEVKCEYVKSLTDGFLEKQSENKITLSGKSVNNGCTVEELNEFSKDFDIAVVTLKRYGSEGCDRNVSVSGIDETNDTDCFNPSKKELEFFGKIEKSEIESVVLILNISSIVNISFIEQFPKIKAVLLTFLPGMEAGRCIADVLCGDVNPCGKLTDTIAYRYEDYPSAACFDNDADITEYKEDIFVGYRYFETFAPEKVMFPFGFGLSYTTFEFSNCSCVVSDGKIKVTADVKNTGKFAGKEVVQIYSQSPSGALKKPVTELRGFTKTKLLKPGETEKITVEFDIKNMASFDADGVTGNKAAWVLEKGDYIIRVGNSVRNTHKCGTYTVNANTVTEQLSLRFDGSEYKPCIKDDFKGDIQTKISLYDVAENKSSIYDFIKQLSADELISLAHGQPPAFPLGTAGVGNLKKYDVPNPQTADGPAGVRRSINTTCFPCGTLIACSWDKDLQFRMGEVLGIEGLAANVDILLAPSMNIHRNPLCGRNFEYLSEDPLVSGKTAAAIVRGIQSTGLRAAIKHFAANNREGFRTTNSSEVSERALREIYLKGFETAIKESNPAFVMTSYNKINGTYTAAHSQLLRGVLRDEWGYEGAVMTDWRTCSSLKDEINAGNNIKMPFGYPDQAEIARKGYENGELTLETLRENAFYILNAVMKTNRFITRDFGKIHTFNNGIAEIPAVETAGISATSVLQSVREDNTPYLYHLKLDVRAQRTFIYYYIDVPKDGEYHISAELSTNCTETQLWYYNENEEKIGTAFCRDAADENKWYDVETKIKLHKGTNTLKVIIACEPYTEHEYELLWGKFPKEDVKLAKLTITL